MKTALISTEFWESDDIASLNSDTRSVYLCLLTNPKRNTTPVFKLSNRLLSFYSGYNLDVVQTCISQLESKGFIAFLDGYYILLGQEYVKAKRGKLTQSIEEKYLASLPENVLMLIDLKENSSRVALEEVLEYKDNNKDNNINKDNKEDIKLLFDEIRIKHKQKLKGKARGLETEWKQFTKKHPKADTSLLEEMKRGAAMYFKAEFNKEEAFKYTPHFQTWYNQSRWEEFTQK